MFVKNTFLIFCASLLMLACGSSAEHAETTNSADVTVANTTTATPKDSVLRKMSDEILALIDQQKYSELAAYFHPVQGVRFSLEAYIDTDKNMKFHKDNFIEGITKNKKFKWGTYDALEEDIVETIPGFFKKFSFDFEFDPRSCDGVKYKLNETSVTRGNTVNNMKDIYNGYDYNEYYKEGCAKDVEDDVWSALRLVYAQHEGKYYLVGIITDRPGV